MYGKASWAAVDILYFMPDIPITFMGEVDGDLHRLGSSSVFQAEKKATQEPRGLKKSASQLRLLLQAEADDAEETKESAPSKQTGLGVKVRSSSSLTALADEQEMANFQNEVRPDQGFDLSKIKSHYEHRRMLRRDKMVLRYGELAPLLAKDDKTTKGSDQPWLSNVLAFARYSLSETAIISVNLSDQTQHFYVDMDKLQKTLGSALAFNQVIMTTNLLEDPAAQKQDYYFLREFLGIKHWQTLQPYESSITVITALQEDNYIFQEALQRSIDRTKEKL